MVLSRPGQVLVALLRGCGIMEPSNEQRKKDAKNRNGADTGTPAYRIV